MSYGIIYLVTNKINSKVYVGKTIYTLHKRKREHISEALKYNSNYIFHKAIRKYGKENFSFKTIDSAISEEELNTKEKFWIDNYNSYIGSVNSNGYNMTIGGDSIKGLKWNEVQKQNHSERMKIVMSNLSIQESLRDSWTYERRKEFSKNKQGKNNPKARSVCIVKDNEIIQTFDTVRDLCEYIKDNYPSPNSSDFIKKKMLIKGEIVHGLKVVYKEDI